MKSDRIFWGLLLIIFGGLFLLQNLGYLSFHFGNLWRLWPLFLIYWGFSALLKQKDGSVNPVLYGVQIIILAILVYFVVKPKEKSSNPHEGLEWQFEEEIESEENSGALREHQFEVPLEGVEKASLDIDFGAGTLELGAITSKLVSVEAATNFGNYAFEQNIKGKEASIELSHQSNKVKFNNGDFQNSVKIAMNEAVFWDLNIETGASDCKLDLSNHKISSIDLSGGASKMALKLGAVSGKAKVNIETGASQVVVEIPATAAARLVTETGLTGKSIEGLTKQKDGSFTTSSYKEGSMDVYQINISAGVASIEVRTY